LKGARTVLRGGGGGNATSLPDLHKYGNYWEIKMTPISQNARRFQDSVTKELSIVKNRVRNLIGNANWGEEGRYKEAVLRNVIGRFLPHNLSIATGFVVRDRVVSKQLDIIVYDNNYPLLFSEGDFIITPPDNVKGIIEVKSNIDSTGLREAIEHFESNFEDELLPPTETTFYGIFSYDLSISEQNSVHQVTNVLENSMGIVNHFALGENYFVRRWNKEDSEKLGIEGTENSFYNIYELRHLAFSYFISNLLARSSIGVSERYWFLFPIEGTKEANRVATIEIPN
jgi:hypothetical protein